MKIEHHSPARLELRQDMAWVALMIFGVLTAISLFILGTNRRGSFSLEQFLILAIPVGVGAIFALVLMAATKHISLDRNAGLVTIRQGWAFGKRTTTYPLSAVEGAKLVTVYTRKLRHKPGKRPVLLIREGSELREVSLVGTVTNWDSNRIVVDVIERWLGKEVS